MDIIFHGRHDSQEAINSLQEVIRLFHEQYHIGQFREMHLSVTLVDARGDDIELVDTDTDHACRILDVYRHGQNMIRGSGRPVLKLVVDNT